MSNLINEKTGMQQFNFISGTQKVFDKAPFLSLNYSTVSEPRAMPLQCLLTETVIWPNRSCGLYFSQTTSTRKETAK